MPSALAALATREIDGIPATTLTGRPGSATPHTAPSWFRIRIADARG